jgi:hypothetical protein
VSIYTIVVKETEGCVAQEQWSQLCFGAMFAVLTERRHTVAVCTSDGTDSYRSIVIVIEAEEINSEKLVDLFKPYPGIDCIIIAGSVIMHC